MSMRDKIEHAIQNQPCTVKELKQKFGGERGADRKVMEALDELVREAVVCQRQGVFFTVRSGRADKALLCKVVKLGKNFAFVMLEDGTSDIFIPGRFTKGAMPGDDVLVEKFEHPRVEGSDEGAILAILTEKNDLVGTVRRVEGRLRFVPDDCPAITMPLARDCEGGAKDGDKVAVEILNRGNRQEDHRVGVAMRFGSSDEAKRCAKALLYAKDIRTRFPDKVRDEAKKFEGAEVSEKDCEGRMDLRALPIFTIDSAETKDIDDAVSLTRCHQRQRLRRKQHPSDPCGSDAGESDPRRRCRLLCGGHSGLRVRKPSGLSTRPQPRDESGAVFLFVWIRGKSRAPVGGRAKVVKEKENLCQCAIRSNTRSRTSPAPSRS